MVYSKWTNIRYACLHPLLHLLEVLCRCDFGQFGKGIFKSIRADKTNFRIGICADKTDARQLYQKIIMLFYKKQTSVWKDKIERSEAVCSTLWILSELQSNFIFHSLLPFIKALCWQNRCLKTLYFIRSTPLYENIIETSEGVCWKIQTFYDSQSLNPNALSTFSYNSLAEKITWYFDRKLQKE